MKNKLRILAFISVSVLMMISCSLVGVLGPAPVAAANPSATPTFRFIQIQTATQPTPRPPVVSTQKPNVAVPVPTIAATSAPCDKAAFVADVTVPDGKVFNPGDPVVKTWSVMNVGSCTWTTAYKLIFDRSYDFISARSINLARAVAPGETADITLTFPAPTPMGTYVSDWNLQDPAGTIFGTGANGDAPLEIRIVIQPKPKVTPTTKK